MLEELLFVIVGGGIGFFSSIVIFLLQERKYDRREEKRKKHMINKISFSLASELILNETTLKGDIKAFTNKSSIKTPPTYLKTDAWEYARFSDALYSLVDELRDELSTLLAYYFWIDRLNQVLIQWASRKPADLGRLCQGQKPERITLIIKKAIDQLRKELCSIPAELQLPDAIEKKFTKLLKELSK